MENRIIRWKKVFKEAQRLRDQDFLEPDFMRKGIPIEFRGMAEEPVIGTGEIQKVTTSTIVFVPEDAGSL